jgi:aspartyl-tRNA(Asn)/glutamyl-tRNA(Gln) amidotransferase subunit A
MGQAWPVFSQAGLAWLLTQHKGSYEMVTPPLAEMGRAGAKLMASDYIGVLDIVRQMAKAFDALFRSYDVLLTPTTAAMPWPAQQSHPAVIAGKPVGPRGHAVFTPFANAFGLPAISLPCQAPPHAMPIGFQLCMDRGRDRDLLALALDYRRQTGQRFQWPPL